MFIPAMLYKVGFKAFAIKQASKIGTDSTHPNYDAAWRLVEDQTVYPTCDFCYWPLLPVESHEYCDESRAIIAGGCYDCSSKAVAEGLCASHWEDAFQCDECGGDRRNCGNCLDVPERLDDEPDDYCTNCGGNCGPMGCESDENPLAGDVDPTGGYYEEQPGASDAHTLAVMRQYGDYTG